MQCAGSADASRMRRCQMEVLMAPGWKEPVQWHQQPIRGFGSEMPVRIHVGLHTHPPCWAPIGPRGVGDSLSFDWRVAFRKHTQCARVPGSAGPAPSGGGHGRPQCLMAIYWTSHTIYNTRSSCIPRRLCAPAQQSETYGPLGTERRLWT